MSATEQAQAQKIQEARDLLTAFGFDQERSNERSALTLLVLAGLQPEDPWTAATNEMYGTRKIMDDIRDHYGRNYKPNTRETIRRFTLHQFVDLLLVEENRDQPDRPVNSPKWNYALHPEALTVLQSYGSNDFDHLLAEYLKDRPGQIELYAAAREMERIPVTLPNGEPLTLSPGGQNTLLKKMLDELCPRFTPGGEVLYLGDAENKWARFEEARLADLGVEVLAEGKMPDLVVYMPDKNWLVLMEAASSHGPVDAKRHRELSDLFASSTAGLVYISCFPDRRTMRKYLSSIAWETEVWCADAPSHMIHFNGDRFLGPHES